jgi:hypothetical protein
MSGSAASPNVIAQLVETMRTLAGPHPGFRPVHAKGIVCSGTFRASAGARAVSRFCWRGQPLTPSRTITAARKRPTSANHAVWVDPISPRGVTFVR